MNTMPTVVVAMSGGVDSSVAAALLVERGYRVIGMMLRLWNEPGAAEHNRCCTPDAMALARRVAARLEIPFYAIDVQDRFRDVVVQSFLDGYVQGVTPNPCVVCNRQIRWGFLMEHARAFGADYLATGHYARLDRVTNGQGGERVRLLRGLDPAKDQSYVLSVLNQDSLRASLFPVGDFPKTEVRALASRFGLPVAALPDSQDLCFLGSSDTRAFLARHAPQAVRPGPIISHAGQVLGEHQGLAFYTIGQRKGLGIAAAEPLYVLRKDLARNTLIVGPESALGKRSLRAAELNWVAGAPPREPVQAQVKIRYKAVEVQAEVAPSGENEALVTFERPLRDITPGQRVVFYDGEECLGGGTIQREEGAA
jgi:tRNA-specific 2-thiouridylase